MNPNRRCLFYYHSTDATITSDDTQISADVVSLETSNVVTKSLSLTAPEEAGSYYYGACVQSVSGEHNTNNNCSDAVRVTVSSEFVYTPPTDPTFSRIYWTDWSRETIQRANLDGSEVETLVSGLRTPRGITLDVASGKMYWTDYELFEDESGTIQRANLDGSEVETLVSGLPDGLAGIALDVASGKMYWGSYDGIQRANLDGSDIETLVTTGRGFGIALDVASGKMYWTDWSAIQRANLDGSNIETLVTGLESPRNIALDVAGGKIYWVDEGGDDGHNPGRQLGRHQYRNPRYRIGESRRHRLIFGKRQAVLDATLGHVWHPACQLGRVQHRKPHHRAGPSWRHRPRALVAIGGIPVLHHDTGSPSSPVRRRAAF